jgi:hypothetical protein
MKLWVDPVSRRAMRDVAPTETRTCMVLPTGKPATAWREKTGASVSPIMSAAAALSSVASLISTPSKKKRRRHNLLWPRVYFSLQLKHRP